MKLTELKIRSLQPQEKEYSVREVEGFVLRVRPSGAKSYYYIYDFNGKRCKMLLGTWPATGIAEARKKHMEAVLQVKRGIDPRQTQKQPEQPEEHF